MPLLQRSALATASLGALLALSTMSHAPLAQAQESKSPSEHSGTMQRADKEDMVPVLKKLMELGAKPVEKLSVEQARSQPTPADAVKALLKDQGKDPKALMDAMNVAKKDMSYPTGGGQQPIRIYTPQGASGLLPVIVYYHGGGWVIADIRKRRNRPAPTGPGERAGRPLGARWTRRTAGIGIKHHRGARMESRLTLPGGCPSLTLRGSRLAGGTPRACASRTLGA